RPLVGSPPDPEAVHHVRGGFRAADRPPCVPRRRGPARGEGTGVEYPRARARTERSDAVQPGGSAFAGTVTGRPAALQSLKPPRLAVFRPSLRAISAAAPERRPDAQ